MSEKNAKLPYKESVGIMLINRQGLVWVGRRLPKWQQDRSRHAWQMPQGGIYVGEKKRYAALRELTEEVGTDNVELLAKSNELYSYDLPDELLGVALGGKYRGHRYKWFAMRFLGKDDEIDISDKGGYKAEFDDWQWVPIDKIPELSFSFRRKLYEQIVNEFRRFATPIIAKKKRKRFPAWIRKVGSTILRSH